jgi:hypothetical protein
MPWARPYGAAGSILQGQNTDNRLTNARWRIFSLALRFMVQPAMLRHAATQGILLASA